MPTPTATTDRVAETCPTCAGTRRGFTVRVTAHGNVIVDRYGRCPDCATRPANVVPLPKPGSAGSDPWAPRQTGHRR